jgi:PAS domain S-box-containing protein
MVQRTAELSRANDLLKEEIAERKRVEERLLKQTEIQESILSNMGDAVIVADKEGKILVFNPAAERMFGSAAIDTTAAERSLRLGLYLPDKVTPFPVDELPLSRSIRGEQVDDVEMFVRNALSPGGLWTRISGRPLRDVSGEISGGVIVCRDITERKHAEEQLSLLQEITVEVAGASDLVSALRVVLRRVCEKTGWVLGQAWIPRPDGTVLDCSSAYYAAIDSLEPFREKSEGVSLQPGVGLPGRVWSSKKPAWVEDVTLDPNFPRMSVAAQVGLKAALALPILSNDEVLAVIEFFLQERRPEDEALVEMIATVAAELHLVIERKRAEDNLVREKNFSDTTIDSLPGVFYHYDEHGRFIRWNQNFEQVTGYSHEEISLRHPLDYFAGDDRRLVEERIGEVFVTGEGATEADFVCKDGRAIPYFFTGRRAVIDGKPHLIGVGIDISQRKHAEEELRRTHVELAHVSRVTTMGELAASIAHEVNQPLGAIVGNAEICLRWLSGAADLELVREALSDIVKDGHRASKIISRIRALVKKSVPHKVELEVNEVVGEVIALVGPEAQGRGVVLHSEPGAELPHVQGDRVQLQQVLLNLMMNGIEAMTGTEESRTGDRTHELTVTTGRAETNGVLVSVRDTGVGIDPQQAELLFKAFHTTKAEGLGMGLAISRSIVEAHGGRLWATANNGPGATFQFLLPSGGEGAE